MARTYLITLIMMLTISMSSTCERITGEDDKLTLTKEPYTGELRINGYFYYKWQSSNSECYQIYFLYKNGILLDGLSPLVTEIDEMENQFRTGEYYYSYAKNNKLFWGIFQTEGNAIRFEKWYPSSGGGMPVYLHKGEILNDTTFVITKSIRPETGEEKDLNEIFHFKEFSPKPDSTNNFIK